MKKIIAFATLLLIVFISVGCKSAAKITENDVIARIDDKYIKEGSVTFVNTGKIFNQSELCAVFKFFRSFNTFKL